MLIALSLLLGVVVLTAGTLVHAPQVGVAAALGFDRVPIWRPIRVLILSTGTELVRPGEPLRAIPAARAARRRTAAGTPR